MDKDIKELMWFMAVLVVIILIPIMAMMYDGRIS
jgi:hypothetical protein